MPDFTARITTAVGGSLVTDFSDTQVPSRLNPLPGKPHRHVRVPINQGGIKAFATVGGVDAPADSALDGRLFHWWWVQVPGYPVPPFQHLAGKTSEVDFPGWPNFTGSDDAASALGVWVLGVRRLQGGAMLLPFTVEAT